MLSHQREHRNTCCFLLQEKRNLGLQQVQSCKIHHKESSLYLQYSVDWCILGYWQTGDMQEVTLMQSRIGSGSESNKPHKTIKSLIYRGMTVLMLWLISVKADSGHKILTLIYLHFSNADNHALYAFTALISWYITSALLLFILIIHDTFHVCNLVSM